MSERKVVGRGIAILLGIICIVLIAGLVGVIAYYTSTYSHTNAEYDAMWTPQLIEVNLVATQNSGFFSSPWLSVTGYVVNAHNNWAYNCKLHVVAYQTGGVTAIDTYINLGTIAGESSDQVNSNLYYTSGSITSYTMTPEWTATP